VFHIRTTRTGSDATAVQIVFYKNRKLIVAKHIGSTRNKEEVGLLKETARLWIETETKQQALFSNQPNKIFVQPNQLEYQGFRYILTYESLYELCKRFRFHKFQNKILIDMVIARVVEPESKVQSLEFLKEFIGIEHKRRDLYRQLPRFLKAKNKIESYVTTIAKQEFSFDYSLVFYDVTTLYFESNETDELRRCGFSKDNKFNQPQIMLGLLVNADGFPVGYQIFEGNKFEGNTLIPVVLRYKRKHHIKIFTVVADAAMISSKNVDELTKANLQYIVGARVANLSIQSIKNIYETIGGKDNATMRIKTDNGDLICEFSAKRFAKDKHEMEKSITKAEYLLKNKGSIKKVKFISNENNAYSLNKSLIEKTKLLLGMKGYYTNLNQTEFNNTMIIEKYHNLWRVEQAFRIAKSDLQMRPMYHFKKETIEAHILICFMALAICKYMELKTGQSTKHIIKLLKSVTDVTIINTISKDKFTLRSKINDDVKYLLKLLAISN